MKKYLFIAFSLPTQVAFSQCVEISYHPVQMSDQVRVDVRVNNFTNIIAFQFATDYSEESLVLDSVGNFNEVALGFGPSNFNTNLSGTINLAYLTNGPGLGPISLQDNSILFSIFFSVQNLENSEIGLSDSEMLLPEFVIEGTQIICHQFNSAQIFLEGSTVEGKVIHDLNNDCIHDTGEQSLENWLIRLYSDTYDLYQQTDENGDYFFIVPPGEYTLELLPINELWTVCEVADVLSIVSNEQEFFIDLQAQVLVDCPRMRVDISTPFLRRCFTSTYTVAYANEGTQSATDASVEIELDPFLTFESTTATTYTFANGIYTFPLGDLAIGASGTFTITVTVDCENTLLGQTHCTTALAYPNDWCNPLPEWNGAHLEIDATCEGDSVRFTLTNSGPENMLMPTEFIVVEDDVMIQTSPVSLDAQESYQIAFPANGSTFRGEVAQVNNHPSEGYPVAVIEGCTEGSEDISLGYINMFSDGDGDPFLSIDCQENIGSYDPNDKRAFPKGYNENHLIKSNTDLEYIIRFQNTGTDTAFTVVVEDQISENLTLSSIRPGVSSHKYSFRIKEDRIVEFTFPDIQLVDSFTNESGSHGFVKFYIEQVPDLADGSLILNDAQIFFDFNDPVVTNLVDLEIGSDFVEVISGITEIKSVPGITIAPNPSRGVMTIDFEEEIKGHSQLQILNTQGILVFQKTITESPERVHANFLPPGIYLYIIHGKSQTLATGKLIIY